MAARTSEQAVDPLTQRALDQAAEQGYPEHITDPAVLDLLADALRSVRPDPPIKRRRRKAA